jgi:hypothetical protein
VAEHRSWGATMSIINFNFTRSDVALSTTISSSLFGSSFENRGLSLSDGSAFSGALSQLPIQYLRYPGGSQTETFFDLSDPNATSHESIFTPGSIANSVPVSDFVSFIAEHGIKPIFVLPTFRYFDKAAASSQHLTPDGEADIRNFVRDVLSGVFGEVSVAAFEIGNEWFNSQFLFNSASNPSGWTAVEYGRLQGRIAEIVHQTIIQFGQENPPEIWVQSGQNGTTDLDSSGVRDNVELLRGLGQNGLDYVDGVVDHFYQPTRGDTPVEVLTNGSVASTRIARLIQDGWDVGEYGSLDIVASEWNIRAARNEGLSGNDANITGFERLSLFMSLFVDMVDSGVDWAQVYTVQGLGASGGAGILSWYGQSDLTPTGLLFKVMAEHLVGTRLLDPDGDGFLEMSDYFVKDAQGEIVGTTYSFHGGGH